MRVAERWLERLKQKAQGRREAGKGRQGQQGLLGWRKDFNFDPKGGGSHEVLRAEGAAPCAHLLTITPSGGHSRQ